MRRLFAAIVRWVWVGSTVLGGTAFGALYGWQRHGLVGAIALGLVGLVTGALLAGSPRLLFELLS